MPYTTYSFLDMSGVISHPAKGAFTFTGEGVGELIVTMSTEKTAHEVSADGVTMISKIAGDNGTVTINVQQTSAAHRWLLDLYNYVLSSNTAELAKTACTIRNTTDGTSHRIIGMSPQKVPDKTYQAQGQRVSWVFMAGEIQNMTA